MHLDDDWFILEYTSHLSTFLSRSIKTSDNFVISMVLQPGLAATTPSISTVMSSRHWSQWLNMQDTSSSVECGVLEASLSRRSTLPCFICTLPCFICTLPCFICTLPSFVCTLPSLMCLWLPTQLITGSLPPTSCRPAPLFVVAGSLELNRFDLCSTN